MIKPIDIQEKEFTKAVRGYKEDEVNEFLDEITIDLERILDELRQTKEENSRLVEELERHRSSEGTVLETLEAAKSLMADISASAEREQIYFSRMRSWMHSLCRRKQRIWQIAYLKRVRR